MQQAHLVYLHNQDLTTASSRHTQQVLFDAAHEIHFHPFSVQHRTSSTSFWNMHDHSHEANKETIVHCARLCITVSQCKHNVSSASAEQLRHTQQNKASHDLTKIKQTKTVREYVLSCASVNQPLTLWRPLGFGDLKKKTPKRTWLCAGISQVWYALQTR